MAACRLAGLPLKIAGEAGASRARGPGGIRRPVSADSPTRRFASCTAARGDRSRQETASSRSRRRRGESSPRRGGAVETVLNGETGFVSETPQAFADVRPGPDRTFDAGPTPPAEGRARCRRNGRADRGAGRMVNHNRWLVAFHVTTDALLGVTAFILAYQLRFHSGIISSLIRSPRGAAASASTSCPHAVWCRLASSSRACTRRGRSGRRFLRGLRR